MPKELSFKINNTVVDSRNKIKKFYNASINRKTFLILQPGNS